AVKNQGGKFVPPTLPTTSAAAVGVTIPSDLGYTAINSPNAAAYPIVSQTFIIAYVDSCKAGTMSANQAAPFGVFMKYGLGPGQEAAKQLSYAPLPPKLLARAKAAAKTLVCNGKSIGA